MGYDNPNHMLNIVNKGAEWVGLKKTPRSLGGVFCSVLIAHLIFYKSLCILSHIAGAPDNFWPWLKKTLSNKLSDDINKIFL